MIIKVKVLNEDDSLDIGKEDSITDDEPQVLTSTYVRELNRGLSHRLRQIAHSHSMALNDAKTSVMR